MEQTECHNYMAQPDRSGLQSTEKLIKDHSDFTT